jgi:hypothetical protein
MTGAMPSPASNSRGEPSRVFSARLDAFLDQLQAGETPNSGTFCAFCYNPLPTGFERCDYCGHPVQDRKPVPSLPEEVLLMHRRKQKRESLVVNSLAYLGLALSMAIFLGMVAINVLYLERALWFFVVAIVLLMVNSRVLPGIIGGVIGDEVGYRYANKRLAEDWAAHVSRRETGRGEI